MPRYLIGSGWDSTVDAFEAPTLEDAELEARARSINAGVDREGLDECAWARPWDDQLARELGLVVTEEAGSFKAAWDQANRGPW